MIDVLLATIMVVGIVYLVIGAILGILFLLFLEPEENERWYDKVLVFLIALFAWPSVFVFEIENDE